MEIYSKRLIPIEIRKLERALGNNFNSFLYLLFGFLSYYSCIYIIVLYYASWPSRGKSATFSSYHCYCMCSLYSSKTSISFFHCICQFLIPIVFFVHLIGGSWEVFDSWKCKTFIAHHLVMHKIWQFRMKWVKFLFVTEGFKNLRAPGSQMIKPTQNSQIHLASAVSAMKNKAN